MAKNLILVTVHPLTPIAPPLAMLHCVSDSKDSTLANWCVSRKAFLQLLDTLEEAGYKTTHFAELEGQKRPGSFSRKVILTFDDCAKQLFDFAVPQLVKRNLKAAFFMPTAYIGGYNAWDVEKGAARIEIMDEKDLKELVRLGMEVGSHSHHHIELKNLSGTEELKQEVSRSKDVLEAITGRPVYSFAYPFGSVPDNYKSVLSEAGYRYGLSIYQPFETKLALRRFGVYEKDTPATLRKKLSGRYRWMRTLYDAVKKT